MSTEKMKKRRYVPQQLALALVLSAAALQASAESVKFNSDINIKKEDPCGITITSEGTNVTGTITVSESGLKTLQLNDTGGAKIMTQASGGEDCRIGTVKLGFSGDWIHGSPALSSASSSVYFPFDYALGPTQVTNAQGENEDESQVFDKISVDRYRGEKHTHPVISQTIDNGTVKNDKLYHYHDGNISWQTNGKRIYFDKNYIPFWIGRAMERVIFDGATSKAASFSLIPVTSIIGYDKATGEISQSKVDAGDGFSNTMVLTVTTI